MSPVTSPSGTTREGGREQSDSERLTWMVVNHASFGTSSSYLGMEGGVVRWDDRTFVRRPCLFSYEWHCFEGATPREAIDHAMDARPCAEQEDHRCINTRFSTLSVHETPNETLRARLAEMESALAALSSLTPSPETRPDAR